MKKKKVLGTILAATVALSATLTGCSLVSSNNRADMEQVIAEVNITKTEGFAASDIASYKDAVGTTSIIKRDLVAYFLNAGYSYVSSGYSYSTVFNMLVDSLVDNAVLTQYSVMYLLSKKEGSDVMSTYSSFSTDVAKYEWLLGADSDEVKVAKYSLLSSLNSAIDSYEESIVTEDDSTSGTDTRTTPTGVDTEQDDYYPADEEGNLNYGVYTGYEGYLLDASGSYKDDRSELLQKKSTRSTRVRAYNRFISSLISSNILDADSDLHDILALDYIQNEYATQLEQQIINKYYDLFEEEQVSILTASGESETSTYLQAVYDDLYSGQSDNYEDADTFTAALSSMSDSSFILYAPSTEDKDTGESQGTYGFVYNILLPFSTAQSALLTELQTVYASTEDDGLTYKPEYYTARNILLQNIKTTDQRSAWFNGATEYAFNASDAGVSYYESQNASGWLFFENNLTKTDRYESLEKYFGEYSYNGTVVQKDEGYVLLPAELTIDDMLDEFEGYVDYVLGYDAVSYEKVNNYYKTYTEEELLTEDSTSKDKEIDYSNFIYATGKVDFGEEKTELDNRHNLLKNGTGTDDGKASTQYLALSAVNELQYAYTTDTGVLSQYLGYSVDIGDDTGYIKEFEYAAQSAIENGAGSFAVCAGDYGWHLIYVTYTFSPEGGEQYQPDWKNITQEGTFEYYFYEWIKGTDIGTISTTRRNQIITRYSDDNTVTLYESRYQDLLDLDSES